MLVVLDPCVLLFVFLFVFFFLVTELSSVRLSQINRDKFKNLPDFEVIARKKDGM